MSRSILIAGDSNLKQLPGLVRTNNTSILCVPGARLVRDVKGFRSKMYDVVNARKPDLVLLHIGSNDVLETDIDLVLRHYEDVIFLLAEELPYAEIGVCGILPRTKNLYASRQWNQTNLPNIRRNVDELNRSICEMTKTIRQCFFVDYSAVFSPDMLAKDGLHVNRAGAYTLRDLMESCIEEVNLRCTTPLQAPNPQIMTYADVVKVPVGFKLEIDLSYETYGVKNKSKSIPIPQEMKKDINKSPMSKKKKMEKRAACNTSFTKQKPKKRTLTKPATVVSNFFSCPVCPVTCTREEHLLDHYIRQHVSRKRSTINRKRASLQQAKPKEPTESPLLQVLGNMENKPATAKYSVRVNQFNGNYMYMDKYSSEEKAKKLPYNSAVIVKRWISACWKNFRRLGLLLSGDIEENPGPAMMKCKWESCPDGCFERIPELTVHLIGHIHPGSLCKWNECVYSSYNSQELECHVLKHIYMEEFLFTSLEEWEMALPLGKISEITTDLHLCPVLLRSKLRLPLMDEDFRIPHQYPYTIESHQRYLLQLQTSNHQEYDQRMETFLAKKSQLGENWNECEEETPTTSNMVESLHNIDSTNVPKSVYSSNDGPPTNIAQIITNRPELMSNYQSSNKFTMIDVTSTITKKFVDQHSRRRKHTKTQVGQHSANLRNSLTINLDVCKNAIYVEHLVISKMKDTKFFDPPNNYLQQFEDAAINISTYPDCAEGTCIFTMFKIEIDNQDSPIYYIRYIESGYYKNMMSESLVDVLCSRFSISKETIFLSEILTSEDQHKKLAEKKEKESRKTRSRPDKIYAQNLNNLKKRKAELQKHAESFEDFQLSTCFIHSIRHGFKVNIDSQESDLFFLSFDSNQFDSGEINNIILRYPEERRIVNSQRSSKDFMTNIIDDQPSSLFEQSAYLNLLSNDHSRYLGQKETLRFKNRFSISAGATSLRNRILYLYKEKSFSELHNIYQTFQPKTETVSVVDSDIITHHNAEEPTAKRKRIFGPVRKIITKETVLKTIQNPQPENLMKRFNIYDGYKKSLLNVGKLVIQVYDEQKLVAIMNDYDDENGEFKTSDYVRTTMELFENGYFYTCSCRIYRTLLECVENDGDEPYGALDVNGMKCMHCRFLKDEILANLAKSEENNGQDTNIFIETKIKEAVSFKDAVIVELPSKRPNTKKFSVLIEEEISFVHLTYNSLVQRYIVSCMNGYCKSRKGSKRNVELLSTGKDLCIHLTELKNAPHFWNEFATVQVMDDNDELLEVLDDNEVNNAEVLADVPIPLQDSEDSNFDVASGMWSFPCLSTHAPRKQDDPDYVKSVRNRYLWSVTDLKNTDKESGSLRGPDLLREIPDFNCLCGAGWTDSENLYGKSIFERKLTVYTKVSPVQCKILTRICVKPESPCKLKWDEGHSNCIHVVTRDTAAGDEIGWAFVNHVLSSKITFSSFCELKTKDYKEFNPDFRCFMDPSVFIKWWFSWASSMQIDFRKPCPVCKFTPKQLACDGTKVGIGFRHARFEEINKPDDPNTTLPTLNRRMTRCFLFNRPNVGKENMKLARLHLEYLAKLNMNEIQPNDALSADETLHRNNILMTLLDDSVKPSFRRFLGNMPELEKISYTYLIKMLATTAPVISLIPHIYFNSFNEFLNHLSGSVVNEGGNGFYNRKMHEMREYSPEIRDLIASATLSNFNEQGENVIPHDILLFLQFLMKCVTDMNITVPDPAVPQFGTYNPPKYGRAYYFSETGQRLRDVRKFSIDTEKKSHIAYDDPPLEHDRCEKYFSKTQVAARGTSTLFLWFCPTHGHCYGFHMTNAEGRKDPAASLYTHLETPPKDIFYDFACNFQEYCLNRESGYYRNVRYFHDIFHGFAHKCSTAYRSSRLIGFETINSEICEQFNSFIQCIKSSARQMSQEHFCFYLQFFLHQWNEKKRDKFEKRINVALAGI